MRNVTFSDLIGAVSRRLGYSQLGGTVQSGKDGLGAFVHRYPSGTRAYAATNNAGDTATILKYLNAGTWTDLAIPATAANTRISALNFLDEAYVVGANSTTFMSPVNIDSSPAYSTTRNILNMPKAKWIAEYQGSLYAINVNVGGTKYPDRAYKSSPAQGVVTFVKTDQTFGTTYTNQVPDMTSNTAPSGTAYASSFTVGSDPFKAFDRDNTTWWASVGGTATGYIAYDFGSTKTVAQYTITGPTAGNATYGPKTWTFEGSTDNSSWTVLDTQTNVSAWGIIEKRTYTFTNNTPYRYYRINITANQGATEVLVVETEFLTLDNPPVLKVDSVRYLKAGMAIDVYKAGTETKLADITIISVDKAANTIFFAPTTLSLSDNDEIWLDGRKGKLSVLWNTDYPTPESSDYLRIPPGQDEDSAITGWAKTNNRLILFTSNSFTKWDGQNFVPVSTTIGCLQHECIRNIGAWIIWPHTTGIWAYNDSTGQLKLISRGIKNWFKAVPLANWASASAIAIDNIYKISVGGNLSLNHVAIQGNTRFVYDFDMNIWSIESHTRNQRFQFTWTVSNVRNPYFQDDTGLVLKDEDGNLDLTATIPWFVETGRNNFAFDELKSYQSVYIYAEKPAGVLVQYQIDGGRWETLGGLEATVQKFDFRTNTEGHDINFRLSLNADGEAPIIEGISTHYSVIEGYYAR
jgi:hypothetical protein